MVNQHITTNHDDSVGGYTRQNPPTRQRKGGQRGHQSDGTWPEDLGRREKALEALRLRKDHGLTWDEIAEEVGYANRSNAYRAVSRLLERVEGEKVEDYRQLMSRGTTTCIGGPLLRSIRLIRRVS
ncbi:hypothetical protein GS461_09825 [Rhodococcus hoagii]|nr:hypothetical protein [Prescottella equi]